MTRRSIKFDCHYCLNSVTAWQDECGREFPCPHCKTLIIVPSQPIDSNLFDDIFESLNPTELDAPSSGPVAPRTEIAEPEFKSEAHKSTVSKPASDTIAPMIEGSKTARQAEVTSAASPGAAAHDAEAHDAAPSDAATLKPASSRVETSKPKSDSETRVQEAANIKQAVPEKPLQNVMEQLLDEAAESTSASSEHDLIELDEETAPEPDIADVPLKIDGWDFAQPTEVISLKCKICDSRIHTEKSKIDTEITCPVCYTKILVTSSLIDKLQPLKQGNPRETKMSYQPTGKQAQSSEQEADIPLIPLEVDSSEANSTQPALAKVRSDGAGNSPKLAQSIPGSSGSVSASTAKVHSQDAQRKPSGKPVSRREKYEAAQRRLAGLDQPRRANKGSSLAQNRPVESDSERASVNQTNQSGPSVNDAPVVEHSPTRFWTMLNSPGLLWRAVLAAVVIGLGSGMMHRISRHYTELREPTIPDWILNTLAWAGMGLLPYFLGIGLLWLLCGFVFREAASGNEQVSNWSIQSFGELKSTFLVFGFSFFIAGLPISPIPFMFALVHPLRCLIAPLFLVSAWHSQNPLAIVSVDAFQNFRRESNEWGKFYLVAMGMALIGFIGGLLMLVSLSGVSFLTSLLGAALVTVSTVIFAAATGWHAGWVISGISQTKSAGSLN